MILLINFNNNRKIPHKGIYKEGCRCGERLSSKDGGERLTHTRWTGERGDLRRGKCIGDEKFVSGRVENSKQVP